MAIHKYNSNHIYTGELLFVILTADNEKNDELY